jgi:HSP20 family molecular chaperone IbpA
MFGGQLIRFEDRMNDGRYEIRAELPGIDPATDLDVSYRDGILTVSVGLPQAAHAEKHNSGPIS